MFEIPVVYILMGQVFINTILLAIVIKEGRQTQRIVTAAVRGFQDATTLLERLLERVLRQPQ